MPGAAFLEACPTGVRSNLVAILKAVAEAPPPRFAGGLQWQAMHGDMAGFYEARAMGPGKRLYRVFCILEREAEGLRGPSLVIITGLDKPNETAFSKADYRRVRSWATSIERGRLATSSAERGYVADPTPVLGPRGGS